MKIDLEFEKQIEKVQKLIDELSELENKVNRLTFVTVEDLCTMTGWSPVTVQNLFNRADFPSCNFGKTKIAEISAVKKYFSVPHRK